MSRSRGGFARSVLLGLALVALIAGVGWVVHERFVAPAPPPAAAVRAMPEASPEPRAPPAPEAPVAIVLDVDGRVERGQGQAWKPLRAGDRLSRSESIRANAGGQAELRVGDDARVTLFEDSEVMMAEVTRTLHALRLKGGRVRLDYPLREGRLLRLETEGGAVAETRGARFTVLRSGLAVAVATEAGAVNLNAAGASVRVGAGEQSVAWDGERPSAVAPIPREVLLQVARRAKAAPCATVAGKVRPGTAVRVDGMPAEVGRDGRFRVRLPPRAGREKVRVEAREPAGGVKERYLACAPPRDRPRRPPGEDDVTVRFDWDHAP